MTDYRIVERDAHSIVYYFPDIDRYVTHVSKNSGFDSFDDGDLDGLAKSVNPE